MSTKNILLATRPLTPPWDEASKNFAYFLAKSIRNPELRLHLLTVKHSHSSPALDKAGAGGRLEGQSIQPNLTPTLSLSKERGHTLEGLGENCVEHPIYLKNDENHAGFPLWQKAILPLWLAWQTRRYDIVHYLFTPTKFNAFVLKKILTLSTLLNKLSLRSASWRRSNPLQSNEIPRQARNDRKWERPRTIQTIATLREDLYTPEDWRQMFFADQLVTYSDYSKNKLEQAGFTNVRRIYPGIDLEKYLPRPKDTEAMQYFNLTPEDFVVLYPGEYVRLGATDMLVEMLVEHLAKKIGHCDPPAGGEAIPAKNDEIDAITSLPRNDSKVQGDCHTASRRFAMTDSRKTSQKNIVFIFGNRIKNEADRKKKEEVVEKLTTAGVIDQVRFTDTWKDMPTLYNLADVVVFPAGDMKGKFDIPLAIIEPYACAKPVILSDLPIFAEFSNPEISVTISTRRSQGEGGYSSTETAQALWQAIEDLQGDEAKRKALSIHARAFVEQSFDLQQTAEEYGEMYSNL
jgi:glycosyltransferase involved in cell wall biosynthesis